MEKITSLIVCFTVLFSSFVSSIVALAFETDFEIGTVEQIAIEEKIYCHATIDQDFDDSSVLVVMDKRTGGINKRHNQNFFGSFEKNEVHHAHQNTHKHRLALS